MCSDTTIGESATASSGGKMGRLQSSIQFPYGDLETALEIARAMQNSGYRECAPDQLAAAMNQQASSGNFRQKVSAARAFGLIETSPGRIILSDLGYRALDPAQQKKAFAEAFLSVELYRRLYDDFRGKQLPPRPAALERAFENYGVSPKQTDKARHAFDRSAKQAGFFIHGNDRLVMPGGLETPVQTGPPAREAAGAFKVGGEEGGCSDTPSHLDPLITALLQKMPPAGVWPLPERVKWFRALAINLSFVYDAGDSESQDREICISLQPHKAGPGA